MNSELPPVQLLIADDDPDFRGLLRRRCESMGFEVLEADNAMDALSMVDFYAPEIAVLDVRMPGGNGISVAEMLVTQSRLHEAKIIVMTGASNEVISERCKAMKAELVVKNEDFWPKLKSHLERCVDTMSTTFGSRSEPAKLHQVFCDPVEATVPPPSSTMTQQAETGQPDSSQNESWMDRPSDSMDKDIDDSKTPWVLAIDDDPDVMLSIERRFETCGIRVVKADRGIDGYRQSFSEHPPAAVLLDYQMPDGDGEYTLRRLRESDATRDVPVIVITGQRDASLKRRMLSAGASAFLNKPVTWESLRKTLGVYTDIDLRKKHVVESPRPKLASTPRPEIPASAWR
ncbi:MAG: response regulator [Planctomycetota bacterium]